MEGVNGNLRCLPERYSVLMAGLSSSNFVHVNVHVLVNVNEIINRIDPLSTVCITPCFLELIIS